MIQIEASLLQKVLDALLRNNRDLNEAAELLMACGDKLYFHGEPDWSRATQEVAARIEDYEERRRFEIADVVNVQLRAMETDAK